MLVTSVAWWLGATLRDRRDYAVHSSNGPGLLEAARLELAEQAVAAERLRLARELHDVVAHSLAIIALHSSVGAHNAAERPEDAAAALGAINTATRSALAELRALLAVLRNGDAQDGRRPRRCPRWPTCRRSRPRRTGPASGWTSTCGATWTRSRWRWA